MKDYTIYVTEEIAKKAMEKGFECKTINYSADLFYKELPPNFYDSYNNYFLPTAEHICGWLRNEHRIYVDVGLENYSDGYVWGVEVLHIGKDFSGCTLPYDGEWKTYEEALLEGINKALNLI